MTSKQFRVLYALEYAATKYCTIDGGLNALGIIELVSHGGSTTLAESFATERFYMTQLTVKESCEVLDKFLQFCASNIDQFGGKDAVSDYD